MEMVSRMFNSEFDRSLWLMIISDKNNRYNIINFIKSIPNDLFYFMDIELDKYMKYEESNVGILDRGDICLRGECKSRFNGKYSFIIDMIQNSLTITKSIFVNNQYKKEFEIVLFAKSRYNNVDLFSSQLLGNIVNYNNENKSEYGLIDGILGKMVVCSDNNGGKKYKRIGNISEKMELENIFNRNNLVRVKKNSVRRGY